MALQDFRGPLARSAFLAASSLSLSPPPKFGKTAEEGTTDAMVIVSSAETILTLKNCESIHFGILRRGFVEKESIHDSQIVSCIDTRFIFTIPEG